MYMNPFAWESRGIEAANWREIEISPVHQYIEL